MNADMRLLDDSVRAGVRPDSVQASGGTLSYAAAHPCLGVALYRFASPSGAVSRCGSRGDCPARSSNARLAVPIGPRQTVSVAWRRCSSGLDKLSVRIEVVDDHETVLATGRFGTDKAGYAAMRKHVAG
jgi:hypothetical protein